MVLLLTAVLAVNRLATTGTNQKSLFAVEVEQTYTSDGVIADVELTTRLQEGSRAYYRSSRGGRTLLHCIDDESRTQKIWTESLGRVLVTGLPDRPNHQKRAHMQVSTNKKELRTIRGVKCYPIRSGTSGSEVSFVSWVNAKDPGDVVADLMYVKGNLVDAHVQIESRPGREKDKELFAFPKSVPESLTTRKAVLEVIGQFLLDPVPSEASIPWGGAGNRQ
jgi:hypothetical protein